MYIVAFDIEGTGDRLTEHAMVELGAAVYHYDRPKTAVDTFHRVITPRGRKWEPRCVQEFWMKNPSLLPRFEQLLRVEQQEIPEDGEIEGVVNPKRAMREFVQWCQKDVFDKYGRDRVVFIGDALYYDVPWINMYLSEAGYPPLYMLSGKFNGIRDLNSMMIGMSLTTFEEIALRELWTNTLRFEKAWIRATRGLLPAPKCTENHTHNAMEDAKFIGQQAVLLQCAMLSKNIS